MNSALRAGIFKAWGSTDPMCFGARARKRFLALFCIVSMSPPGYPSAWLHPCRARFRCTRQDDCKLPPGHPSPTDFPDEAFSFSCGRPSARWSTADSLRGDHIHSCSSHAYDAEMVVGSDPVHSCRNRRGISDWIHKPKRTS